MRKVLAIIGPTASGKTKLSIEIAKRLEGEIISADSRQVYKMISIATAQPAETELNEVRHFFINEMSPYLEFNAGEFGIKGRKIIDDIFKRNKQPIITGGSGLYLQSLIDGFFKEEVKSKEVREMLCKKLDECGEDYLYEELKKIDKESFESIPPRKVRRVIRALEAFYVSGKKISDLQKEKAQINFKTVQIGLMTERKILYDRINNRVDVMLANGLLDEVRNLKEKGFDYRKQYSVDTVGIKEAFKYLEGEIGHDEMVSLIKQNSRRYAKRQMTWFRRDKRIHWINVTEKESGEIANEVITFFNDKC